MEKDILEKFLDVAPTIHRNCSFDSGSKPVTINISASNIQVHRKLTFG